MKLQSIIFVLLLATFAFTSTRSLAQTYSIQPTSELEASQEAYRLGEEMRRNEPVISETQKGEKRSAAAMHWKFISENQQSQPISTVSKQPIDGQTKLILTVSDVKAKGKAGKKAIKQG